MFAIIKEWSIYAFSENSIDGMVCIEYDWSYIQPKYENWKIIDGYTPSRKEIGDAIVEKAFEGNPHAQLADLVGAVLGLAYLLAQSHGKANVKAVLAPLLGSLEAASDVREEMGLSRFDASFLD